MKTELEFLYEFRKKLFDPYPMRYENIDNTMRNRIQELEKHEQMNKNHIDNIIQVGTTLRLKKNFMGNKEGDIGVCFNVYKLGDRNGFQFIFENREYSGFSPDEIKDFFYEYGNGFVPEVSDYNFENVIKLSEDHRNGYFDIVWGK